MCIFLIIISLGPLLDYLGRVSTSGLRSGALYIFGSSVTSVGVSLSGFSRR